MRASDSTVDKDQPAKQRYHRPDKRKHSKVKAGDKPHVSKKAKKVLKEKKEIDMEMREAEAEVDKEERANNVSSLHSMLYSQTN